MYRECRRRRSTLLGTILLLSFCEDPLLSSHRLTYVIHWIDDQLLNGKDLARCVALDWRFCA